MLKNLDQIYPNAENLFKEKPYLSNLRSLERKLHPLAARIANQVKPFGDVVTLREMLNMTAKNKIKLLEASNDGKLPDKKLFCLYSTGDFLDHDIILLANHLATYNQFQEKTFCPSLQEEEHGECLELELHMNETGSVSYPFSQFAILDINHLPQVIPGFSKKENLEIARFESEGKFAGSWDAATEFFLTMTRKLKEVANV